MNLIRDVFSPDGRLLQLESAMKAIDMGCTNVERIVKLDEHIGCALSGLLADARRLIDRSRVECQKHWFAYDESMPIESCTQFTSTLVMQSCDTDENDMAPMSRPVGVALYLGKAIGSRSEFTQRNLEAKYRPEMDAKSAIELCLITLQQAMDEQLRATNVEVMFMTKDNKEYNKHTESD
ncbi:hypothetical protein ACLKA6_010019 [Drosophila palustris]